MARPPATQQRHLSRLYHLINVLPDHDLLTLQDTEAGVDTDQSKESVVHAPVHRVNELFSGHDCFIQNVWEDTMANKCIKCTRRLEALIS